MVDEQIPVYNANIQGQQVKTLDAVALKNWFIKRRIVNSVQKVNLDSLPNESVYYLVAKVCQDNLNELEGFLDQILGLVKEEEEVVEEKQEEQSEEQFGSDEELDIEPEQEPAQKVAKAFSGDQSKQRPVGRSEEIIL